MAEVNVQRKPGFYWVRYRDRVSKKLSEWTIGEYRPLSDGSDKNEEYAWALIGSDEEIATSDLEIGAKVPTEEDED